jgi:hypothetical protein
MVEQFNQTLIKMLGTLDNEQKQDWKFYVITLVHAYNATKNESTGFSLFFSCLVVTRVYRLTRIWI